VVYALPPDQEPPRWVKRHDVVRDHDSAYLADPQGNLVGMPGQWCNRIISARWTEDTRRLAG
jgi:hypothetical protein